MQSRAELGPDCAIHTHAQTVQAISAILLTLLLCEVKGGLMTWLVKERVGCLVDTSAVAV